MFQKHSATEMRQDDTVSLVKSIITSEFRELKCDLNISSANSKSPLLKRNTLMTLVRLNMQEIKNNSMSMFQY